MADFGVRLGQRMRERGPLCVGIDPHASLLERWDLPDTPVGLREFSLRTIDALGDYVAAFKPQSAFYERHGAQGVAVLEEVLQAARAVGVPTILDVKRGDIGSTMDAYADAYLEGSLRADALTVSPYLGPASLKKTAYRAASRGRGLFVLALTSNPEGAIVQHAGDGRESVARTVVDMVARWDRELCPAGIGPVGIVIGATIADAARQLRIELADFPGLILAPGVGAQGAGGSELRAVFGASNPRVLASASRSVLAGGPDANGLREAFMDVLTDIEVVD
ncbi:orotidine-5'-phosphate decarboxylase [Actinobaculum sp. 352]|nr:orotidine-5'-phosphate decarboxylase [Actinobaculum sp. 313]RTE48439.1 orotidine-5'-phosphate decarboxylase [Actinobaculum sp. 352]